MIVRPNRYLAKRKIIRACIAQTILVKIVCMLMVVMQIKWSIILHWSVQIFFEEDEEERLHESVHWAADEHHHLVRLACCIYIWSSSYQCHQEQEDLQVGEDRLQATHRVLRLWQLKVHVDLRDKKYEVNVGNKSSLWSMLIWIKTIQYVTYMTSKHGGKLNDVEELETLRAQKREIPMRMSAMMKAAK